jgi:DNA-binding beta-propeller fold protein YncE
MSRQAWRGDPTRAIATMSLLFAVGTLFVAVSGASATPMPSGPDGTSSSATSFVTCAVGSQPSVPAYDPVNHYIYVPNIGSNNISVIRAPCLVVATIPLPGHSDPYSAVFDPANNYVYVSGYHSDRVYLISGTQLIHTIVNPAFCGPEFLGFDPVGEMVAVPNSCHDTVSFIRGTDVVKSIAVGNEATSVAYDAYAATLLVTDFGSNNVTVLNADNLETIKVTPGFFCPIEVAFDAADHLDYVTNLCSLNKPVTLLTSAGERVGTVAAHGPFDVVWSQSARAMYVSVGMEGYPTGVDVISGHSIVKTISLPANGPLGHPTALWGEVYSEFNDKVYVTDLNNNILYVVS